MSKKQNKEAVTAKELYAAGCCEYLRLFCEKHGFDYKDAKDSWVADCVGDIALCGDYYVSMQTIITDINEDAPEEEFFKWYDYTTDAGEFGLFTPNFRSWLSGCPRIPDKIFKGLNSIREAIAKEENKRVEIKVETFFKGYEQV